MADSDTVDLGKAYAFAVQLGKDAGSMLMKAAQARFDGSIGRTDDFQEKESAVDIVTKTDEGMSFPSSWQRHRRRVLLLREASCYTKKLS